MSTPARGYPYPGVDIQAGGGHPRRGVDIYARAWTLGKNNVHARAWTTLPGGGYPWQGMDVHAQEFFITD
jgi:hypothetical protein